MEEPTLIARREGGIAHLTLNRPRALNALDGPLIAALTEAARRAAEDPAIRAVVLEGAGGRAFSAGGDVRAIRSLVLAGDRAGVHRFFAAEYALNRLIAEFPKPWISLIGGVCMGGGCGVSVHGSHRVVTESALIAMPETAIALFPDVGMTYVLPRLPDRLGIWLGLTGARLAGAEAVEAGLATHFVPAGRLDALRQALFAEGPEAIARFAAPAPQGRLAALRPSIARCFGHATPAAILAALAAEGTEWAREQAAILRRASPFSVAVSLEAMRRGAGLTLPECLAMELRLTATVCFHPDFAEGVRAVLVDKDNAPRWTPPSLEALDPAAVAAAFGG
ncbi:MAG: enoyl-CoA hydratase/isomerase family protein [Acetobacteraceae bacterium]|nr:enoyl-CoA hydratase/isomerase family protein [Acetobacteraceae bacterium]